MTTPISITFCDHSVEAVAKDGKIFVNVRRVCESLGLSANRQLQKVQDEQVFEGSLEHMFQTGTDGKRYKMLFLELDAFLLWLGSISTAKVKKESRPALVAYKQHCKKALLDYFSGAAPKAQPSLPACPSHETSLAKSPEVSVPASPVAPTPPVPETSMSPARLLLQQAQLLVAMEDRLASVEQTVEQMHQRQQNAARALLALPEPEGLPMPRTLRSHLVARMRGAAEATGLPHNDLWNKLYIEFRDRYHVDLKARAKNGDKKPLDVAEEMRLMTALYDLACFLWPRTFDDLNQHSEVPPAKNGLPV